MYPPKNSTAPFLMYPKNGMIRSKWKEKKRKEKDSPPQKKEKQKQPVLKKKRNWIKAKHHIWVREISKISVRFSNLFWEHRQIGVEALF